jgi:hypothetical protein
MISKIISDKSHEESGCKKGELYQNDTHGDDIVVLCTEDESCDSVAVVVLRDETNVAGTHAVGDFVATWAACRLVPFLGTIQLSE